MASWFNDFKTAGRPNGMTVVDTNALHGGHVGRGAGLKRSPHIPMRFLSGVGTARRCADRAARTCLQGPVLSDPWRRQHGLVLPHVQRAAAEGVYMASGR